MFGNDESQECKFKQDCKLKLCQYKHSFNEKDNVGEKQTDGAFENVHSDLESKTEEEDLECDECGRVSDIFDAYSEHRGKSPHGGIRQCAGYIKDESAQKPPPFLSQCVCLKMYSMRFFKVRNWKRNPDLQAGICLGV